MDTSVSIEEAVEMQSVPHEEWGGYAALFQQRHPDWNPIFEGDEIIGFRKGVY